MSFGKASDMGIRVVLALVFSAHGCASVAESVDAATCVEVDGFGQTSGSASRLAGSGTFEFDGEPRATDVGLYIDDTVQHPDGSFEGRIRYQFGWNDDGLILTDDVVTFQPRLEDNGHRISRRLTVVSGLGRYASLAGTQPLNINAVFHFEPPRSSSEEGTATEEFQVVGRFCAE